ncbi:hypothetical protein Tsubulata_032466 [Turnera subulata]|uniref:Uncharacterized protein n=1 Tax=Turnera subulata TaxID=218843 RepID=A0A9Q0JHA0_9ROSI|nr:hypothetical protein Tsubulata_032466 [Turnera subulata]
MPTPSGLLSSIKDLWKPAAAGGPALSESIPPPPPSSSSSSSSQSSPGDLNNMFSYYLDSSTPAPPPEGEALGVPASDIAVVAALSVASAIPATAAWFQPPKYVTSLPREVEDEIRKVVYAILRERRNRRLKVAVPVIGSAAFYFWWTNGADKISELP